MVLKYSLLTEENYVKEDGCPQTSHLHLILTTISKTIYSLYSFESPSFAVYEKAMQLLESVVQKSYKLLSDSEKDRILFEEFFNRLLGV
jgi:hypothetical protein